MMEVTIVEIAAFVKSRRTRRVKFADIAVGQFFNDLAAKEGEQLCLKVLMDGNAKAKGALHMEGEKVGLCILNPAEEWIVEPL